VNLVQPSRPFQNLEKYTLIHAFSESKLIVNRISLKLTLFKFDFLLYLMINPCVIYSKLQNINGLLIFFNWILLLWTKIENESQSHFWNVCLLCGKPKTLSDTCKSEVVIDDYYEITCTVHDWSLCKSSWFG